jgi:hypothetical protein
MRFRMSEVPLHRQRASVEYNLLKFVIDHQRAHQLSDS